MRKVIITVLLLALNLLAPLHVIVGLGESNSTVFITKHEELKPLCVFRNYIIGLKMEYNRTLITAVDIKTDDSRVLGIAEAYGLNITSLACVRSDDYFYLTDGRLVLIYDKNLDQKGRLALSNVKGLSIINDTLVAFSNDTIYVSRGEKFVNTTSIDVFSMVYSYLYENNTSARGFLEASGIDADQFAGELLDNIMKTIVESNGTIISTNTSIYYDLSAPDPISLRKKLRVDVKTAGIINGTVYFAVNIKPTVIVSVSVTYSLRGKTNTVSVNRTINPLLGFLFKISSGLEKIRVVKEIEAGVSSNTIAFVFVPLLNQSLAPRQLMILYRNKIIIKNIYGNRIDNVKASGNYILLHDINGIIQVLDVNGNILSSFLGRSLLDYGVFNNSLYICYTNNPRSSSIEIGLFKYSGRYGKLALDVTGAIRGIVFFNKVLAIVSEVTGKTLVEIASYRTSLSKIIISYVNPDYVPVTNVYTVMKIMLPDGIEVEKEFSSAPITIQLPPGSILRIHAETRYASQNYTYTVTANSIQSITIPLTYIITPLTSYKYNLTYKNMFAQEYIIVNDSELTKYTLPGGIDVDAYRSYIFILRPSGATSTIEVFIGHDHLRTIKLAETYSKIKVFFPYIIAYSNTSITLLDVFGNILVTYNVFIKGYDIDVENQYFTVWSPNQIIVYDMRRQYTTYLDWNANTVVVLNGLLFIYSDNTVYVVNIATKGVVDKYSTKYDEIHLLTNGVFKAVAYREGNNWFSDILSIYNGVVRITGRVLALIDLGYNVNADISVIGNRLALALVDDNGLLETYVVGRSFEKILVLDKPCETYSVTSNYIVYVQLSQNNRSIVTVVDWSGGPRLAIVTRKIPFLLSATDDIIVYGDSEKLYLVEKPYKLGKYVITIVVKSIDNKPLRSTISIEPVNMTLSSPKGVFTLYTSIPGKYTITARAEYYESNTTTVNITEQSPVVNVVIKLKPSVYTVHVKVVEVRDNKTIPVTTGTIIVKGRNIPENKTYTISGREVVLRLRKGVYQIEYYSEKYTTAMITISVPNTTEVTLQVKRVKSRIVFEVYNKRGEPLPNALITISSANLSKEITLTTNNTGIAETYLPTDIEVNATITKEGYSTKKISFNTSNDVYEKIILSELEATLSVIVQDEEGRQEKATVYIYTQDGQLVTSKYVEGADMFNLPLGIYKVKAVSDDGRSAEKVVEITTQNLNPTITLTLPKKPQPFITSVYTFVPIILVVVAVVVLIYKRYRRKKKAKVQSIIPE